MVAVVVRAAEVAEIEEAVSFLVHPEPLPLKGAEVVWYGFRWPSVNKRLPHYYACILEAPQAPQAGNAPIDRNLYDIGAIGGFLAGLFG